MRPSFPWDEYSRKTQIVNYQVRERLLASYKSRTEIFFRNKSEYRPFVASIRRIVKKLRIGHICSAEDVILEAWERGYKQSSDGILIDKLRPWLRATVYNICREKARKYKIECPLQEEFIYQTEERIEIDSQWKNVQTALDILDEQSKDLLVKKVVEQKTWSEIQRLYSSRGKEQSLESLRQAKVRALKKLREIYHSLENVDNCH